eukprot:3140002-Amphidinium_carterae.1
MVCPQHRQIKQCRSRGQFPHLQHLPLWSVKLQLNIKYLGIEFGYSSTYTYNCKFCTDYSVFVGFGFVVVVVVVVVVAVAVAVVVVVVVVVVVAVVVVV